MQTMNTIHRNQNSVKTWLALIIIIAGFCLASPSTAEAAVAVDAVSSNSTIGTSITISHTTSGSNRLMLVGVSFNNDNYEIVTGVTYNGVGLTLVGTEANVDDARVEIWRLIAPDTGTYDVVVTFSADLLQEGFAGVVTFTGVHQTTPLGTFASAAADGIAATVDVSSAVGELVFDVLAAEYSTSATVGAGQTERWNLIQTGSMGVGSTEPGAATVTMSWTLTGSGDHWAIGGVSIKPAPAGASDLDQIHYRWRNDDGGESASSKTTQVSETLDTTTTSATWVALDGMSIMPGAGDYLVWFSGSIQCGGNDSMQNVALALDGSEITHTVRNIYTENSIPNTPFPVATHAYISGVTAGQTIGVYWQTSGGTATMHERTLVVTAVDTADVINPASATTNTTTTSASYTALDSMLITPGAGDYMVWFSGSMEGTATNSRQDISIFVGGVEVPHAERQMFTEGSIPNVSFPVATHAKLIGVGALEDVEVRWRTTAGTATMHERTLVVYKINASNFIQKTATVNTTTTSTTDVLISGMTTTTTSAGDYLIWFSSSLECDLNANLNFQYVSIYVNGSKVPHTERDLKQEGSLGDTEFNVMTHAYVENVGANQDIEVRWRRENTGIVTMFDRTLVATNLSTYGGASWAADQDTSLTNLAKNTTRRLRLEVSNEGTGPSGDIAYRLEVSEPNPASPSTASYTRVDSSTHWNMTASTYFTDADLTSNISPGLDDENTTFVDGQLKESTDETTTIALSATQFTEIEYALQATSSAIDGATYYFRLTNASDDSDFTYTRYAEVSLPGVVVTTNYRSIGTNTGILYDTGNASIDSGTTTVAFGGGASLPLPTAVGAVGVGDELVIGGETFYILSWDSETQVTVQSAATSTHSTSYTIKRAYNDIQTWENDRDGNLMSSSYVEVGVCYKDGPFMPTATTTIDGSTTDAMRYMLLTVATGQQHSGTAGTGVVVDGSNIASSHVFHVRDTYFRMELLEIRNYPGDTVTGQPINLSEGNAGNNLLSKLIIHDYTSTGRGAINVYETSTVRNCIFYNGDKGIRTYSNDNLTLTVENVTIYNMTGIGVDHQAGKLIVKNTISVGSGINRDFDLDNDAPVDGSSGYNMYSGVHNNIHPGASSGLISISFDGPTKTITRSTGSFVDDGFVIGNIINTDSGTNPGPFTITNVTALVITVSEAVTTQAASSRDVFLDVASVIRQSPPASLEDLFISISSGSEDLHIESSGHNALDNGQDLSGSFTDDIDGYTRPQGSGWDIGADEYALGKFLYRRKITIDNTKVGSSCASDLSNFPVLINITADWLKTTTADPANGRIINENGYDIVFRAANGTTHLDHEKELYDGTNGQLIAWVRIPTLSYTADTDIYIYYGNDSVTDLTGNPTGVWDSDYVGVWHLDETSGTHDDSTQSGNNGTASVTTQGSATGKIDGADEWSAAAEYVQVGTTDWLATKGTVEMWVRADAFRVGPTPGNYLFGHTTDPAYANRIQLYIDDATGLLDLGLGDSHAVATGIYDLDTLTWYRIVLTWDSGNYYVYVNGGQAASGTYTGLSTLRSFADIGNHGDSSGRDEAWDGIIDEVRVSKIARDLCWVQTSYNNQNSPSTFYTLWGEESDPVTAVSLISFTAKGYNNDVKVEWETAQEIDNMGFHLYRGSNPAGPFTRLTDRMIPGLSFSVMGRAYSYVDSDVTPGRLYYYKLEDIDVHGKHTFHGPICVDWDGDGMPDDWEIAYGLNPAFDDSGLDPDGDGLTNLEEYEWETDPLNPDSDGDGIPDGQEDGKINPDETTEARTLTRGVQILASDETGITLELRTDAFDMEIVDNEGVAFERLRILDYIHGLTTAAGKPELPMKGILLDLPEGKSATLKVEGTGGQTLSGYWVYPVPEKAVHGEEGMEHVGEFFVIDEAAYSTDVFYPNEVAQLGQTYIFRGQQRLQVIFYPLAFNPGTRELMHYTRIRVRVTYEDAQERYSVERSLMAAVAESSGLRALAWSPPPEEPAYRILVSDEGIYRITSDSGLNVDGMDLSQVRLYNLGQEVAISVHDGAGDDYIEFYGRPVEAQYAKYAKYNVYWLTTSGGSGSPKRMEEIDGTPGSAAVPVTHTFTVHHEQDLGYWILAPGGDSLDRWFFYDSVSGDGMDDGGDPVDFTLSLPGVAGASTGKLTISMGGYYDTDHEVDVSVNGVPVGTFTWSGIAFYQATMDGVDLSPGDNTVTIECKTSIDTIVVDWFEVEYPRDFAASNETLKFCFEAGYRYQISGFTGTDLAAFDITSPGDVGRVVDFQTTGTSPYTLDMEPQTGSGERTYMVLSTDAGKSPVKISKDVVSNLSDVANGADYILITHRDLGWDGNGDLYGWLSDLVAFRQAQGLRVKVVDVEDVYDEFSYGITTPQAVKDFISYTYTNWTQPAPLYVLFVGDSTYDPKNNWSSLNPLFTDTATYLPTYLTFTNSIDYMGETVTDEWFVRVSGDDAVPDLYIGRIPAASVDEAAVMVNKIITYEGAENTKTWEKNVLLVADNQTKDYEAVFETMNEDVAALIPTGLNDPFKGYLDDYVSEAYLTEDIKAKINEGTLVVNYSGHGATEIWADEHIFDSGDVAGLTNQEKLPFFVSMSCLTGYFADPEIDTWDWGGPSLAEVLLRSEGKGAVAALMPTGMTTADGQHILDASLFDAIFTEDIRTLGLAVSAAKQTLLANGVEFEELSETFLLFGDPAMKLKIPLPRRPSGTVAQGQGGAVALSWQGAEDCNGGAVSGYNLYQSTTSGGEYTKVNTSLITGTEYNDTGLEAGTTHYYVVTSVDSDGDESVRSQEVGATPTALKDGDTPGPGTNAGTGSGSGSACFISSVLGF